VTAQAWELGSALARGRVPVSEEVSELEPLQVFGRVLVLVLVFEPARVLVSEPALAREPVSEPESALRERLWEDCPSALLCPSRWQWCKSVRARRQ
jgi:hypothetical protein